MTKLSEQWRKEAMGHCGRQPAGTWCDQCNQKRKDADTLDARKAEIVARIQATNPYVLTGAEMQVKAAKIVDELL